MDVALCQYQGCDMSGRSVQHYSIHGYCSIYPTSERHHASAAGAHAYLHLSVSTMTGDSSPETHHISSLPQLDSDGQTLPSYARRELMSRERSSSSSSSLCLLKPTPTFATTTSPPLPGVAYDPSARLLRAWLTIHHYATTRMPRYSLSKFLAAVTGHRSAFLSSLPNQYLRKIEARLGGRQRCRW